MDIDDLTGFLSSLQEYQKALHLEWDRMVRGNKTLLGDMGEALDCASMDLKNELSHLIARVEEEIEEIPNEGPDERQFR